MFNYKDVNIRAIKGDITELNTDAIVNAANNTLLGGGGVDGAIHRAGGPEILEQCKKIGGCPTGEARITVAGNLPSKYVIHTVGPRYGGGRNNEEEKLYYAYQNSLKLADEYNLRSIAFPSISTGIYGYPIDQAVVVALKSLRDYIDKGTAIKEVVFVLFSDSDYNLYVNELNKI